MNISKETLDAAIDQLKKNFKEVAILGLVIWVIKLDGKIESKDQVIKQKDMQIERMTSDDRSERREHLEFVTFVYYRVQRALDSADAKINATK